MPIDDQASKLRRMMQQAGHARTVAVVSGKGGVGKSNIALNLSILLSAAGNRTTLVDADFGLANLDVLVGVEVRATLAHVLLGARRLEQIIVDLPCGVQLVPGANGLGKMANLSEFQRSQLAEELARLETDSDVIVVDCGAGVGADVMHFAASADHVLVVTVPEPTAITDAYALVKLLTQRGYPGQMSLVVNLAPDRHVARQTYERIAQVARQFTGARVYDAGCIFTDPRVAEAVQRRQPVALAYPRCSATRCLQAVAVRLCSGTALVRQEHGFFRRVVNWLS
jgi:flagellar biosynthesis protein FlhG